MASKNKTEKLGLNSWVATDRPQRNDFNSDNLIIDEALGSHIEDITLHLTDDEKSRVSRPVVPTSYVGNGQASRTVALPYAPNMVIVFREDMPLGTVYDGANTCVNAYSGVAIIGGASEGVSMSGSTLTVTQQSKPSSGYRVCLNEANVQYKVAIIK